MGELYGEADDARDAIRLGAGESPFFILSPKLSVLRHYKHPKLFLVCEMQLLIISRTKRKSCAVWEMQVIKYFTVFNLKENNAHEHCSIFSLFPRVL